MNCLDILIMYLRLSLAEQLEGPQRSCARLLADPRRTKYGANFLQYSMRVLAVLVGMRVVVRMAMLRAVLMRVFVRMRVPMRMLFQILLTRYVLLAMDEHVDLGGADPVAVHA